MTTNEDFGKLILRLMVGGLMLFHGIAKITGGIGFITAQVTQAGFPEFLAYGVYVGEIVAPILLILGLKTKLSATVIAFTMVVAIYLVHPNDLLLTTKTGAWAIELQMFYLLSCISIIFLGAGRFSFDKK
jgi:putative oxidoreductase